jgi:D-alanine-D-alanine ligase
LNKISPKNPSDFEVISNSLEHLFNSLRFAVIYNGSRDAQGAVIHPAHNPRSEKSYRPVAEDLAQGLRNIGFHNVLTIPDDLNLAQRLRDERIDLAWLNTAGIQGLDSAAHTPSLLELSGIPYVGHRPLNVLILDNKHIFKGICAGIGIPTPPFIVWDSNWGILQPDLEPRFNKSFGNYDGPFIVKPVNGRASLNVMLVNTRAELPNAVEDVYQKTLNQVQIEKFVGGPEYCVSVCGPTISRGGHLEQRDQSFAFSILERVLAEDEKIFTSMDVQPITTDRIRLLSAQDGAVYHELEHLARTVYNELQLRTLIRLDVRADSDGKLYVLEANPKPDLKRPEGVKASLACAGLYQHGMSYEDLLLSLLADTLSHYGHRFGNIINPSRQPVQ